MKGLEMFRQEVECGSFPGPEHTPYHMAPAERTKFLNLMMHENGSQKSQGLNFVETILENGIESEQLYATNDDTADFFNHAIISDNPKLK